MKVLMFGEIVVGTGVIHQADFAKAFDAERLTAKPKDTTNVRVVVGRLLKGKKPALLAWAEKKGLPIIKVDDLLTQDAITKLADVLGAKVMRESYESRALEALTAMIVPSSRTVESQVLAATPKRGSKKKAVANG